MEPLSKTWRIRSSEIAHIELKYIQESIQRLLDINGRKARVIWKGQEDITGFLPESQSGDVVSLPYAPVLGQAPADPNSVDVIAGQAIHEAGHKLFKDVSRQQYQTPRLSEVFEDSYIDKVYLKDKLVLSAYVNRARSYYRKGVHDWVKSRLLMPKRISRDELVSMFGAIVLYDIDVLDLLSKRQEPDAASALETLSDLAKLYVERGRNLPNTYTKTMSLAEEILSSYDEISTQLAEIPSPVTSGENNDSNDEGNQEGKDDDNEGKGRSEEEIEEDEGREEEGEQGSIPQDEEDEDSNEEEGGDGERESGDEDDIGEPDKGEDNEGNEGDPSSGIDFPEGAICMGDIDKSKMPYNLAQDVWDSMAHDVEDFYGLTLRKPDKKEVFKAHNIDEFRQAFDRKITQATELWPFQESGRISRRTISGVIRGSKTVFEQVVQDDNLDACVVVLLDASSSIQPSQWEIIRNTAQALYEAFQEQDGVDLYLLGYQQSTLHRVYEPGWDGPRIDFRPNGGTPTAEAMKLVREKIRSGRKDKIVINLTDGMPNSPSETMNASLSLMNDGWDVIGIVVTGVYLSEYSSEELLAPYKKGEVVNSYSEVPGAIRKILDKL